ncbi:unnamed protein product [Rodentolepis nana]|uniref:Nucleolar protein 6 n=1 Tax=Rodentolepis nana TaxID=102285 RepID=A0A0R3TLJ1_RODNA|nr:unnamed protein product [Rodentolepis nana]
MYALDDLKQIQKSSSDSYLSLYPNSRVVFISPKVFTLEMYPVPTHVEWLLGQILNPLKIKFEKPIEFDWEERKRTAVESGLFTVLTTRLIQRNLIMRHHMVFTEIPLAECPGLRLNVLHSMDFFTYMGPLLLVLQSTNPSAIGVWDTTLLSPVKVAPEDIKHVSQEGLVEEAHKRGYRVAFVNLNHLTLDGLVPSTKISVWVHRRAEEPFIYPLSDYSMVDPGQVFLSTLIIQRLLDCPALVNLMLFNSSLAFRTLSESESEALDFKSQEETSDEFVSPNGENELGFHEENLQAWVGRALKYWLSLKSKVKAVAFVVPSDPIMQSIYLETGDAFMVPDVLKSLLNLPYPEDVRSWFVDVRTQF